MIDVFISFSTRGGTDLEWIVSLGKNLKSSYKSMYGKNELEIWDMSKNGPGENFVDEISKALKETLLLIVVMDPSFNNNVQVLDEIDKYQQARTVAGEPVLIIKIIKNRGDKDAELRAVVDSNLLVSYFSTIKSNNIEEQYKEGSTEYNDEVGKIVKEIRKHKVEQRRKINSQKLLNRLAELNDIPKIYVAFGDSNLTDNRLKFINELNGTIINNKNDKIREVKVIPDDFTIQFDYEALGELLCEENPYREKCLDAMLNNCRVVILPFESDKIAEAENYLKRIKYQLKDIWVKALDLKKELPVHILLNIPEVLYKTDEFKNELNNPAYAGYKNIKLVKNQIITSFIESFVEDLRKIVDRPEPGPEIPGPAPAIADLTPEIPGDIPEDSPINIYIIEYNNAPRPDISEEELNEEEINRADLWAYIASHKFTLIPRLDPDADFSFSEAKQYQNDSLSRSDAIIIYRGIRENDQWCKKQQAETYKAILELKRETQKKDILRAVYIYPKQKKRERGLYSWCNYNVIIDYPTELDAFLWNLRKH
ncbi:MAG: toll/interleukin-1 receptor domain-containing protein [Ferruginibacter sp.]